MPVEVRHGTLLNGYGRPVRLGGYTFKPADVALVEGSFSLGYRLGVCPSIRLRSA